MVKIGIIGFGTVGCGVAALLQENGSHIAEKTGVEIELVRVADPDTSRQRPVTLKDGILVKDVDQILNDQSITVIVEAIGGTDPAKKFVMQAIEKGKHVVTTNKELIAKHWDEISKAAQKKGVNVLFEGAVGGGIPIINQLRTSLSGNKIEEVFGIVNGTTNYILSKMTNENKEFSVALKEAQAQGFAEADPKNDVEGYDSSYKAAILAGVSFDAAVKWEDIYFEGITKVTLEDIDHAKEFGYVIKLLAITKMNNGELEVRVHPTLVDKGHPLASVNDAFNAIYIRGNAVGEVMFYGKGAGSLPTASSAVSDIIEIASAKASIFVPKTKNIKLKNINEAESRFYIRLNVADQPGVLAQIAKAFGDNNVSILTALQKGIVDNTATLVIITHKVREKDARNALKTISELQSVSGVGSVIRVGME